MSLVLLFTGDSKDFACKLCNKSFKDVSSFQRHCKIHTEERPFICEMCDIGFKMKVGDFEISFLVTS